MKKIEAEKKLLIQHTQILWLKECRGAPHSSRRNQLQKSWKLPDSFFEYNLQGFPIHYQYIKQTKEGFQKGNSRLSIITEKQTIKVANLELTKKENCYEVYFKYTPNAGAPERFIFKDRKTKFEPSSTPHSAMLNEKVFTLYENEYGQVLYNGRFTDFDTGEWYYILNIINLIYTNNHHKDIDIFIKQKPMKSYTQIAKLL